MKKTVFIFIGAPGSGKDEMTKFVTTEFNIPNISTGRIFRDKYPDSGGTQQAASLGEGDLVNDEETMMEVDMRLKPVMHVVLNGVPRSVAQAEALYKLLIKYKFEQMVIIELRVPRAMCVERSKKRSLQSQGDEKRKDDTPAVIDRRMKKYDQYGPPTLSTLRNCNGMMYTRVDASEKIPQVQQSVAKIIRRFLN